MIDRAQCAQMDATDPLAFARERFHLPEGKIYLDGNSLGALPKATAPRLNDLIQHEWGQDLIGGWTRHGWVDMPRRIGAKLAALIGAEPDEVIACDSTSVNLFKLLSAALNLRPDRAIILSDRGNFPSDLYMAQGLAGLLGGHHQLVVTAPDRIVDAITDKVALLMLTEVDYRTGRLHDMKALTARAHAVGTLTIWDLAHSAGAMPIDLDGTGADFAVGCGYKYLNGGPGAPAFLYVARRWLAKARQPLFGWFGHSQPFDFDTDYRPRADIGSFLVGTPPVLSLAALECGIDTFSGIDLRLVRRKSEQLGDLMIALVEATCGDTAPRLASPRIAAERGSQVSFAHPDGYAIMQALIARGIVGDFRAPDLIRFGFAPLYVRYIDVWEAVQALKTVLQTGEWRRAEFARRAAVT